MPSPTILRMCFDVLHYTGLTRIASRSLRGRGIIFCLHHVLPNGGQNAGFQPNAQLEISPEFLDQALAHIKSQGYRFLSLVNAFAELHIARPDAAPFAVLTLDDGYRDNAQYAAPVFRKHQCPYTIFVAPGIADGTCELWWKILEQAIAVKASIHLPEGKEVVTAATVAEKHSAWNRLSPFVADMPQLDQRNWIRRFGDLNDVDVDELCRSLAMNWNELREVAADPLCAIGAHSMKHYRLSRLTEGSMLREMRESASRIESELGKPASTFAYPYGDVEHAGPREFRGASAAGFKVAVTTRKGVVFNEHRDHAHALPRVMLSGRYQELRYLDALMSGLPLALLNRFQRVNVS